jgi:CBS domain-containing protein
MRVGQCGNTTLLVVAQREMNIVQAAGLMREYHVGALIVVDNDDDGPAPVGIVTDRDLVVEVLAAGAPPEQLTVADVMSNRVLTADEDEDVLDALERMRRGGVRRMPVIDASGRLCGVISADDILQCLADAIVGLPQLFRQQREQEARRRQ